MFMVVEKEQYVYLYMKFAWVISILAIIQEIGYILNVEYIYNYSLIFGGADKISHAMGLLRVTSIFSEPAHLGFFLLFPMIFIYLNKSYMKNMVIIAAYILTFSAGNYILFLITLLSINFFIDKTIKVRQLLFSLAMIFIFIYIINVIPEVNEKFNSIFATSDNLRDPENGSFFALYSLWKANIYSFINNPLFGNGFGNSMMIYDNYMYNDYLYIMKENDFYPDEQFFAKFLGELGCIGVFIFTMMISSKWKNSSYYSKVALFVFFIISIKSGSYYNPMMFSLLAFYLSNDKLVK
ncbi:TPA: hypothetical protein ACX6RM_003333 [Photobacterium damselae]|uniref:hypothetical protein n=1 Tax=Photobacterium damselae TaxID=38293 RepID=UPI001EDF5558|nr:hypothetical protein [Photobacterium damselae]MCG3847078.1 hypothetical protein [Photobacterium damselae]